MTNNHQRFAGYGTVLLSGMVRLSNIEKLSSPLDLVESVKRHQDCICAAIEARSGVVYQCVGGSVLAYWHPQLDAPKHAQLAFDAGCDILQSLPALMTIQQPLTYDLDIVLGTGEMLADEFRPIRQFQIVGTAIAIADRISKTAGASGCGIRMSQYTVELLRNPDRLEETGKISRDNLDDLRIFSYPVARRGVSQNK